MKILIVGAGAVGSVICNLLSKEKAVKSILCCDTKLVKFKNKKIKFTKINVSNKKEFIPFLKRNTPEFVVNAATSWLNNPLMESCLECRINYMDMSSMWNPKKHIKGKSFSESPYKIEQLDFHNKFKKKNIFGLINAGVAPGIDNLFAKECAEDLDEIDEIKIRLIDYSGSDKIYFAWSKEVLLEELASKPLIYEEGKFKIMEAFSGIEDFEFPKPFGKKTVNLICQEEIGTIPLYIKVRNVDEKDYDDQMPKQKFLYDTKFLSGKKIKLGKNRMTHFELTTKILPEVSTEKEIRTYKKAQFAMLVQAEGKKDKGDRMVKCWVVFPNQERINKMKLGANFITYPTAISAKLFIMALPYIKEKGVFPPEALNKEARKKIVTELKKYCILRKEILQEVK